MGVKRGKSRVVRVRQAKTTVQLKPRRDAGRQFQAHLVRDASQDRWGSAQDQEAWRQSTARRRKSYSRTGAWDKRPGVLKPYTGPSPLDDGSGLVITILTGGRPEHLERTVKRAHVLWSECFLNAHVVAYVNQRDPNSEALLDTYHVAHTTLGGALTSIGYGVQTLARQALAVPGARWWLHLEDDWSLTQDRAWIASSVREAAGILDEHPAVHQVRLRRAMEPCLPQHMVTGETLEWALVQNRYATARAHWTFNPSLVRLGEGRGHHPAHVLAHPIEGEVDAQKKIHRAFPRLRVAQVLPGIFAHGGEDHSLRVEGGHPW